MDKEGVVLASSLVVILGVQNALSRETRNAHCILAFYYP